MTRPVSKTNGSPLTAEEVRRLIDACRTPRDRCLLRALVETGIGRAEVAALEVRGLSLDRRQLIVRSRKGTKRRVIPITTVLASELRGLVGPRTTGPIFISNRNAAMTVRHVSRIVERAGQLAGVPNPNPGSGGRITCLLLRHTFARLWRERGGDIEGLAHILGYTSSVRAVQLYGAQNPEAIQANYERIMGSPELPRS
jgi:integrase/recombinase XerD